MSLSKIDKNHADQLILSINKQNLDHNALEIVRTNYMQYGKLKYIAKQMEQLKREAEEIITESYQQHKLQNIECKCKKISGNTYHLYKNPETNDDEYLSLIAPSEWSSDFNHIFLGSFYYDYDKTFVPVDK